MKKFKLILLLSFVNMFIFKTNNNAQFVCSSENTLAYDILFNSEELTIINGSINLPVNIISLEPQTFNAALTALTPNNDPFFNINISPDPTTLTNTLFNLGDTIDFTFNITYNQNNLPFGYREITAVIPSTRGR